MTAEYWMLFGGGLVVALLAGFVGGRLTAPRQRQLAAMERERNAAQADADAVRREVDRHFEESAQMFRQLATDYHNFFQQFARTAQNLGLSEGRTNALLQQADPSLVAERVSAGGAGNADATDGDSAEHAATTSQADADTVDRADVEASPSSAATAQPEEEESPRDEERKPGA